MSAIRWILVIAVFAALLVLSVQNTYPARITFFIASWETPVVVVVFVSFACGVAAGLLAGAVRTARLKRQVNRFRREQRAGSDTPSASSNTVPGTSPASGPRFDRY
jgi:uncharacterized integral membrane protein